MNALREWTGKLFLSLLGMVVALVLFEGLARLLSPPPGQIQFLPDAVVGYRHAPDQNLWLRDEFGEYAARFRTNAFGDPDRPRELEKPAATYRIAVIGDSMVQASEVAPEERFTHRLEEQLTTWVQTQPGPYRQVEVLNFGVAGYSTAQEWLHYRSHVRRFDPDLVVLVFLPGNDVKNNHYILEVERSCRPELAPFYRLNDDGKLALANEQFYDRVTDHYQKANRTWREQLAANFRLVGLARRAVAAVQNGTLAGEQVAQLDQDACQTATTLELYDPTVQQTSADWQAAWKVTAALIAQLAADVAADGADFHLVSVTGPWEVQPESRDLVLPVAEQSHYDWELAQQRTAEMAAGLGVAHYPALAAMQDAVQSGTDVHFRYNGHYTPAGHEILAGELLPILQAYLRE